MHTPMFTTCDLISAAHDFLEESGQGSAARLAQAYRELALADQIANPAALLLDLHEQLFFTPLANRRIAHLRALAGRTILDFGCGAGFYSLHLARFGYSMTCIDIDESKIAFLKYAANRYGLADRLNFRVEAGYDAVICINVLDHLPRPGETIEHLAGLTRPGGLLFLYAHFDDDGHHVSDPESIDAAYRALMGCFRRADPGRQMAGGLEVWERRGADDGVNPCWPEPHILIERARSLLPTRHPELVLARNEDGSSDADGDRFYLLPSRLDGLAADLIMRCDGRQSLARICARHGPERQGQVLATLRDLFERRYISLVERR